MTRFLVVPQWQGSPSARAMHLADGAAAIAGDLPRAATVHVEVPVEAGEAQDTGIRRFSALARVTDSVAEALRDADAGAAPDHAVVIGGDCGVAVPAIAHAAASHDAVAVVWFDAHADAHSPETSPSGAFAGMALRAVYEPVGVPGSGAVAAARVVLAGARDFDDGEQEELERAGVRLVPADDLATPDALVAAVTATGAQCVYLHVDLDVLDPAVITGVAAPVPFGLSLDELVSAIKAVRAALPLAGASITGFAPASPAAAVDDLGTILRVVGAVA